MATLRNLKIKTSTCKRIVKELKSYEKEVEREAAKTADMKEKGDDPYDLKQQVFGLVVLFKWHKKTGALESRPYNWTYGHKSPKSSYYTRIILVS